MATYLVSYDLMNPGKDYSNLHKHLKSYSDWAKPLESLWLIHSPLDVGRLRDAILAHMDANDKLLVVDVTKRAAAWKGIPADAASWIMKSL